MSREKNVNKLCERSHCVIVVVYIICTTTSATTKLLSILQQLQLLLLLGTTTTTTSTTTTTTPAISPAKNVSRTTLLNKTRYLRRGRSRIFRFGPRGRYIYSILYYIMCARIRIVLVLAARYSRDAKQTKKKK